MPDKPSSPQHKQAAHKLNEHDALLWHHVKKSITPLQNQNDFEPHGNLEQEFSNMLSPAQNIPSKNTALKNMGQTASATQKSHKSSPAPTAPSYTPPQSEPKNKPKQGQTPPALAPFQTRDIRKIITGHMPIEATLDLHGMTQNKALPVLKRFLRYHQRCDHRLVLVITGKGRSIRNSQSADETLFYESQYEGGVLQESVPLWLNSEALRPTVISYNIAHRAHGEDGALYVRLRRAK